MEELYLMMDDPARSARIHREPLISVRKQLKEKISFTKTALAFFLDVLLNVADSSSKPARRISCVRHHQLLSQNCLSIHSVTLSEQHPPKKSLRNRTKFFSSYGFCHRQAVFLAGMFRNDTIIPQKISSIHTSSRHYILKSENQPE